jgi:hypothetical protein
MPPPPPLSPSPPPSPPSLGALIVVRLFRLWAAARDEGENPLPPMRDAAWPFASAPELPVACASLFDLVEAHLARRLVPECCCSAELSRDERALLGVLRHAPAGGQPLAGAAIPHGLPGAVCWAAFAIRRALGASFGGALEAAAGPAPAACPFGEAPPLRIRSTDRRMSWNDNDRGALSAGG